MRPLLLLSIVFVIISAPPVFCLDQVGDNSSVPTKGMVTMLDIGKGKCIPCKMMAPILKKLKKEYNGKASIVFLDISKDRAPAVKYGIRSIPTQIFFDKNGKEIYRHVGFMAEDAIVKQLEKMGVSRPTGKKT